MEFAAEATAWHLDRCWLGKTTFSTKEEGQRSGFYGRLSVTRERKASCVTRVLSVIVPLRSPRPWCRGVFFRSSDAKRDRYPRLYYKYTCNAASSPTVLSVYLGDRPPIYVRVADTTHICGVYSCWVVAGTISASTFTDIF